VNPIKYLLDENVGDTLRKALHSQWPEIVVWRVGQPTAPRRGTLDPDILLWCEAEGFSLVTNNRESMPVHLQDHLAAGRHVPGIFTLNPKMTLRETLNELALIWEASAPSQFADQITYLPISL
jgi:hypothetical protein